jgi:hypothetical protein
LEISFNRAKLLGLDSIQEGRILLEDSIFGGAYLDISA